MADPSPRTTDKTATRSPEYGITICLICDEINPVNWSRISPQLDEHCPECNRAMYGVLGTEIVDA